MKRRFIPTIVLYLLTLTGCASSQQLHPLAIQNVTLIDGRGGPATSGISITIDEEGRIAQIASGPVDAKMVIDGTGKFLIPGLWDMHVHFPGPPSELFPAFLAYGVTGVRDMGSDLEEVLRARSAIEAGIVAGPRIVTAGLMLDNAPPDWPFRHRVTNASEARAGVRMLAEAGVDFIKVHNLLPRDAYFAAVEEAHQLDMDVAGHVPLSVSIGEGIASGLHTIEHLSEFRVTQECIQGCDSLIASMAEQRLYNTPTLVALRSIASAGAVTRSEDELTLVPPSLVVMWNDLREKFFSQMPAEQQSVMGQLYQASMETVAEFNRRGVPILAGTDIGIPGIIPGLSLHEELESLVAAGLSPAEALAAATRDAAIAAGLYTSEGTIERGKNANMVLLDADPLSDIRNTRLIAAVILRGTLMDSAETKPLRELFTASDPSDRAAADRPRQPYPAPHPRAVAIPRCACSGKHPDLNP